MRSFFALLIALFLCSCSDGQNGNGEIEAKSYLGWRSAGLTPSKDSLNTWGNGFDQITHSGEHIFVIDARVSDTKAYKPASRIFMSKQGSEAWEEMKMPDSANPYKIYADDAGLFVGTYRTGDVWHFDIASEKWTNLNAIKISDKQHLSVYAMGRFNGDFIVSMAGYTDSANRTDETICAPILLLQSDGTWKDIAPPVELTAKVPLFETEKRPLYFNKARQLGNDLFVATFEDGIWRYSGGEWIKVPNPMLPDWLNSPNIFKDGYPYSKAIEVYKGELYVGWLSGIHKLSGDFNSWIDVDSIMVDSSRTVVSGAPLNIYELATDGQHLFASGSLPGIPALYAGDRGEPKGWRLIDVSGWCDRHCFGLSTYGLDIVGDTLYAAAWEGIYKFPLAHLDSAVKHSSPYSRDEI